MALIIGIGIGFPPYRDGLKYADKLGCEKVVNWLGALQTRQPPTKMKGNNNKFY